MNEKKITRLFEAARKEGAPSASPDFATDILRAVHNEPRARRSEPISIWDHLNVLFPRVALAAAAVIVLCVAADWALTENGFPGVTDGAAQFTSQYFLDSEDL